MVWGHGPYIDFSGRRFLVSLVKSSKPVRLTVRAALNFPVPQNPNFRQSEITTVAWKVETRGNLSFHGSVGKDTAAVVRLGSGQKGCCWTGKAWSYEIMKMSVLVVDKKTVERMQKIAFLPCRMHPTSDGIGETGKVEICFPPCKNLWKQEWTSRCRIYIVDALS